MHWIDLAAALAAHRHSHNYVVTASIDHLDFQVGAGQRQLAIAHLHQQVGQNRQGLPSLDDIDHLREWFQEDFALQAETHAVDSPWPRLERMDKSKAGSAGVAQKRW